MTHAWLEQGRESSTIHIILLPEEVRRKDWSQVCHPPNQDPNMLLEDPNFQMNKSIPLLIAEIFIEE